MERNPNLVPVTAIEVVDVKAAACTKENIAPWFDMLQDLFALDAFSETLLFNLDETNLTEKRKKKHHGYGFHMIF